MLYKVFFFVCLPLNMLALKLEPIVNVNMYLFIYWKIRHCREALKSNLSSNYIWGKLLNFLNVTYANEGFPGGGSDSEESTCNAGDLGSSWVGKIPWIRKWQSTPVFLPGKSHGQRSLVGYTVHGVRKESDTTERLTFSFTFLR